MNSFRYNGGRFNGARVVSAIALVTCTASASISAEATYIHRSQAAIITTATVAANSLATRHGVASSLAGQAFLNAAAHHKQGAYSSLTGAAAVQAYCLRFVGATCDFVGSAQATFIPASTVAFSNIAAEASLSGEGTLVQFARSTPASSALLVSADSTVYRQVEARIQGNSSFYGEVGINDVHEAYVKPESSSSIIIEDSGIVIKQVGALLYGTSSVGASPFHKQHGHANALCRAAITAAGVTIRNAQASIHGQGFVDFESTYEYRSASNIGGKAELVLLHPVQRHAAASLAQGQAVVTAVPTRIIPTAKSNIQAGAVINAPIEYWRTASAPVVATCVINAKATQVYVGAALIGGTAVIEPDPIIPVPLPGIAFIGGTASVEAKANHLFFAEADIVAGGGMDPVGYTNLMAPVPAERTFIRESSVRTFERPSLNRTFSR